MRRKLPAHPELHIFGLFPSPPAITTQKCRVTIQRLSLITLLKNRPVVKTRNKHTNRALGSDFSDACRPPGRCCLVGLGRFELPTSPLSGVRSNQLSYRPVVTGGATRDRTADLLNANQALSQLSYSPLKPHQPNQDEDKCVSTYREALHRLRR